MKGLVLCVNFTVSKFIACIKCVGAVGYCNITHYFLLIFSLKSKAAELREYLTDYPWILHHFIKSTTNVWHGAVYK